MKVLYKIFVLLLAGPIIFIFARSIRNVRWFRWVFIGLHALLLTYFTVFILNKPEWRWAEQKSILKSIEGGENKKAYDFVANNFLLIDNSFDKMLLPHPEGDESDSSAIVLTHRKHLAEFLQLANEHSSLVDLVVLDMGFKHRTAYDSLLKSSLLELYSEDKVLLSADPDDKESIRMIENPAVYGNISEKSKDNLFTSHQIWRDNYYSLPYLLYARINNIKTGKLFFKSQLYPEKNSKGKRSVALNVFFPRFYFADEKRLRGQSAGKSNAADADELGPEMSSRHYYFLSQPLSATGSREFIQNLHQRKADGKKNIIFIGAFASSDEDIHHTLYGELHGTTIILNVLYNLQVKNQVLSLGYIFFLLFAYLVISLFLFYHGLGIDIRWPKKIQHRIDSFKYKNTNKPNKKKEKDGLLNWLKNFGKFILYFLFVKELPITLLLLFSFLVQLLFGQWPNILPLIIYLTGIIVSLDYMKNKILKVE